jgi:hypothetical protein
MIGWFCRSPLPECSRNFFLDVFDSCPYCPSLRISDLYSVLYRLVHVIYLWSCWSRGCLQCVKTDCFALMFVVYGRVCFLFVCAYIDVITIWRPCCYCLFLLPLAGVVFRYFISFNCHCCVRCCWCLVLYWYCIFCGILDVCFLTSFSCLYVSAWGFQIVFCSPCSCLVLNVMPPKPKKKMASCMDNTSLGSDAVCWRVTLQEETYVIPKCVFVLPVHGGFYCLILYLLVVVSIRRWLVSFSSYPGY